MKPKDEIRLQILKESYLEHFKFEADLARYLPLGHPKRIRVNNELTKLVEEMNRLTKK